MCNLLHDSKTRSSGTVVNRLSACVDQARTRQNALASGPVVQVAGFAVRPTHELDQPPGLRFVGPIPYTFLVVVGSAEGGWDEQWRPNGSKSVHINGAH